MACNAKIRLNVPLVPELALDALRVGGPRDEVMSGGLRDVSPAKLADHFGVFQLFNQAQKIPLTNKAPAGIRNQNHEKLSQIFKTSMTKIARIARAGSNSIPPMTNMTSNMTRSSQEHGTRKSPSVKEIGTPGRICTLTMTSEESCASITPRGLAYHLVLENGPKTDAYLLSHPLSVTTDLGGRKLVPPEGNAPSPQS